MDEICRNSDTNFFDPNAAAVADQALASTLPYRMDR